MKPPQAVPNGERWSAVLAQTVMPPVLTERRVFAVRPPKTAAGGSGEPAPGTIVAFDVLDGKELWSVELTPDHPLAVDGGRLFVSAGGAIHALDVDSGAIVWRQPVGTQAAAPLVHQGWVITVTDGELIARSSADGGVVWKQPSGAQRLQPTIE